MQAQIRDDPEAINFLTRFKPDEYVIVVDGGFNDPRDGTNFVRCIDHSLSSKITLKKCAPPVLSLSHIDSFHKWKRRRAAEAGSDGSDDDGEQPKMRRKLSAAAQKKQDLADALQKADITNNQRQ